MNYKTTDLILKECGALGITDKTPYAKARFLLQQSGDKKIAFTNAIIEVFEKFQLGGQMYTCPHCASETLIEMGNCHWCHNELLMPAMPLAKETKSEQVIVKKDDKVEEVKEPKAKRGRKPKDKKVITEDKEPVSKNTDDIDDEPVLETKKQNKYHSDLKSLTGILVKAQTKETASREDLEKFIKDLELSLPNPSFTKTSLLRSQVIAELERLIAAIVKKPKVIEVNEKDIVKDMEDDIFEDDEDDDSVVESNDEIDEDDEEEKPAKGKAKSKSKKEEVEEVEDEDSFFSLDDDDIAVSDAEIDEVDLTEDEDDED